MAEKDEGCRSFATFLHNLAGGRFNASASEDLQKLIDTLHTEAQRTCGKVKGELTIALKFTVDDEGKCAIDHDVKTKLPRPKKATAMAWVNDGGNVVFEHPRQTSLPLREVGGRGAVREVGDEGERPAVREV